MPLPLGMRSGACTVAISSAQAMSYKYLGSFLALLHACLDSSSTQKAHGTASQDFSPRPQTIADDSSSTFERQCEGTVYRYRTGIAWRDLPDCYGKWPSV